MIGKKRPPTAAVLPKSDQVFLDQAAARTADAFRFLRRASQPITPRPVAKSGSAAGNGVADAVVTSSTTHDASVGTVRVMELKGSVEINPRTVSYTHLRAHETDS